MSRARAVIGLILALALLSIASPAAAATTPRKAAAALVKRLRAQARRANDLPFAASRVAGRRGRLWLAVSATVAGISIQTIGLIVFLIGAVWLVIELVLSRGARRRETVVRDRPVVRERDVY